MVHSGHIHPEGLVQEDQLAEESLVMVEAYLEVMGDMCLDHPQK